MAVYKRGDKGVFYMNFTVNGVRVFRSTGKFTKKEAKLVEAEERQKMLKEASLTPRELAARTLLSEAAQQVYQTRWRDNKDGKQTLDRANRIVSLMGDVQIGTINSDTVRDLILKLQARGNKPSTVNRFLEILKTILRYKKQEWDFIHLNKQQKGRIRVISKEEEGRAVNLLRNTKHNSRRLFYPEVADLVEVLVDTGMRLSEALKLKYEDVNFETNLISIWINKGGRPRSIPMTQRVRRIMEARQGINKHKPFSLTNDQAGTAWAWVRKEMNLKGDREFVLHALRHTTASRLLNKGCDLVTIRDWLGHADIQTTMRYAHLAPNKLAQAAAILDSFSSAD